MQSLDLSSLSWSLRGWHPLHCAWGKRWKRVYTLPDQVGPVPVKVPGSVQKVLLDAKIIPDWTLGHQFAGLRMGGEPTLDL